MNGYSPRPVPSIAARMRTDGRRREGFTLIELMLTVAIIGISLTMIFLQVDTLLPSSRLQAACRTLVSDLSELRLQSIMRFKQPIHLVYDTTERGYWAYLPFEYDEDGEIVGPGQTEILEFRLLPDNIIIDGVDLGLKAQATEEGSQVTVLIHPDGTVTGHIVHIRDEYYQKDYSVSVASLTGYAEVKDGRVEYEEFDEGFF